MRKLFLTIIGMMLGVLSTWAHINPKTQPLRSNQTSTSVGFRSDCQTGKAQIDQAINNVRARLTTGGDIWWDGNNGRYVVPKVPPGVPEVSSIFAGAVWLGGVDEGGNLKLAAQTYGRGTGGTSDFWPGPLASTFTDKPGTTELSECLKWDKFFVVTGEEIDEHLRRIELANSTGEPYEESEIPLGVKGWPARDNPFFFDVHGFDLPITGIGLAGFYDEDGAGEYNPLEGDFPIIEIKGCDDIPQYPDEMIFWVYNDNGNIHTETSGNPIQMEVQVQAFAYSTNDQLNDMTFQRYKLINRAIEPIDSTFFAIWVDPDLGCHTDDYVGCDINRSLAYVYNEDALDGQASACSCSGVETYCDKIPILGIDYFRGPKAPKKFALDGSLVDIKEGENPDTSIELGMSSFTYYNNGSIGNFPTGTTDPENAAEYYNYLTGSWRDGSPFEYGGDGYQEGTYPVNYAFPEAPNDITGWSMCTGGMNGGPVPTGGDRRTIQASGPFRLDPGTVNELIVGVVWVPDQEYPCPSIANLQRADDLSQALFDNCFQITDGPDAPDLDIIELDQELILVLSNDTSSFVTNNAYEAYEAPDLEFSTSVDTANTFDTLYRFEGYKIYQVASSDVNLTPENVNDPKKVRIVAQVDIKNGVDRLFNWFTIEAEANSTDYPYFIPELKVEGADEGIKHTFRIVEDVFAEGDRRLINHKKYYFAVVAYAYNEWASFDPSNPPVGDGQKRTYLEGRKNIGPNDDGLPYVAIPRPITDRKLNANYSDGAIITRLDGKGTGNNFLDLSESTRAAIEDAFKNDEFFESNLIYLAGRGPIKVEVYNPLDVVDGQYEIRFRDSKPEDEQLDITAKWELRDLSKPDVVILSESTIEKLNEQLIRQLGFSISIGQVPEAGAKEDSNNGFIGYDLVLEDTGEDWLGSIPDGTDFSPNDRDNYLFDYLSTQATQVDADLDPDGGLSQFGDFPLMPYTLLDYKERTEFDEPFLGPVYVGESSSIGTITRSMNGLEELNNVDVVFTSDKTLWSRCVVVETANDYYNRFPEAKTEPYNFEGDLFPARQFDLRPKPSVSKEMGADGLPIPDANPQDNAYGMGWFPGYAIDVETGQRLNVFFGENSIYNGAIWADRYNRAATGGDMMFNPTDELILNGVSYDDLPLPFVVGGQHAIYVTRMPYDGCASLVEHLSRPSPTSNALIKIQALKKITWAGTILLQNNKTMLSYEEGLIPTKTILKLRINNPYQVELEDGNANNGDQRTGTGLNKYHPMYEFTIEGLQADELGEEGIQTALDYINVVPNPYYGFSDYETSQFTNTVKITNLPAKCIVTIYSLEGKFIRQYTRDELASIPQGSNRGIEKTQITPDLEWDLKNSKGIPIASGVYLIHVSADDLGERTLKWFGVNRQFDPSGL